MNWPLLIFLVLFFSIVFIMVIIDMVHENKSKSKKSSFTIFGDDNEYPWPRHGWPFL